MERKDLGVENKVVAFFLSVVMLVFVTAVVYASFPVYPDEGDGEEFDSESGNADVEWNEVLYRDWRYPYDIDGEGDLNNGSGSGYYGTDVSWFTGTGEVVNATRAVIKLEVDYDEQGDATGLSNAYL